MIKYPVSGGTIVQSVGLDSRTLAIMRYFLFKVCYCRMEQPGFITCIGWSKPSFPELSFPKYYTKPSENPDISWLKKCFIKALVKAVLI